MNKKFFVPVLVLVFAFSVLPLFFMPEGWAEEAVEENELAAISGVISEIADDGSYIIVDNGSNKTKFLTTKEFVEEAYLEVGEKVKAFGEQTSGGLKLVDYEYIYEGDSEEYNSEENDDYRVIPESDEGASGDLEW